MKRHLIALAVAALLVGWWYGVLFTIPQFLMAGMDKTAEAIIGGSALLLAYAITYRRKP